MSKDKTIDDCNFCRLAEELNTEEIPYWSKKSDNYSPYPKMVTCEERYSLKNEALAEVIPDLNDRSLKLNLKLGEDNKDKWIFYWAPNESDDPMKMMPPGSAYGKYENHGLMKCDEKGKVTLKFNCPQPYKDEKQTYCRHVHYILEGPDQIWLPLKTIRVICDVTIDYLDARIKKGDCMIINALPEEYFEKEKIPKSVNLSYKSLEKLTHKSKERKIIKFLKVKVKEYPELHEKVSSKKLDIKDVPIIVYCFDSKCNASETLIDFLHESKVNNTLEWKEGMKGWNKLRTFFEPEKVKTKEKTKEKEGKEEEEEEDEEKKEEEDEEEDEEEEGEFGSESSESDESESDESDIDELTAITHEGIEYSLQGETVYDNYLEPIGNVKVVDGKIIEMDDKVQDYHTKMKKTETIETKNPKKDKKDKEQKEDKGSKEKEDKGSKDDDESLGYTRHSLNSHGKGDLKDIVKGLAEREKSTYEYENIKDLSKKELVKLVSICQGKIYRKDTKTDYKFPPDSELNKMKEDELRDLVNEMTGRDPGTYKFTESNWSKPKLIDFILSCQGIPKPRRKGGSLFVGGGWCL